MAREYIQRLTESRVVPTDVNAIRAHAEQLNKENDKVSKSGMDIGFLLKWKSECGDCGVKAGEPHRTGCDVEHCSVCGLQRLQCEGTETCGGHDKHFARYTGFWPGALEAYALGVNLNDFYGFGFHLLFLVKPTV